MRKFLKNNILEIFKTMYEAHSNIKKIIDKKDFQNVIAILSDCQDTAIQIGNVVERSEGENFVTINLLEEYCKTAYEIAINISEYDGSNARQVLDTSLKKAENSVKNDIKVKLEIIFMPYKASMWDSLESIWKTANDDTDCNAHVIPIPYYDRNTDGSFGKIHYEGNEFPKNVPTVSYESYKLDFMKPDIIYIHSPYDEFNNVTSVDPRFYSHELKKYTECLVYVPYYATSGGMSEGQRTLSAYFHVDYMVLQSEEMKDFIDERIPENKILTFGSPKFDKIINACKNPNKPPAGWEPFMKGKRVYFYNTSLGGMLGNTKMFIKKMKYVFETFEERDDVCLIWRPHPLLESTFKSMRPYYLDAFYILKDYYIKNNVGIYDDTPDISNTIALCDAYIGDTGTSVTSLFGVAGKPMLSLSNNITSPPVENDWRSEYLHVFNEKYLVTKNNKLYYSPDENYNYHYLCKLNNYAYGCYYGFYYGLVRINNKTFITPSSGNDIIQVDNKGIVKRTKIKILGKRPPGFVCCGVADDCIFICSLGYDYIACYNTKKEKVIYFHDNIDIFITNRNGEKVLGGYTALNGNMYFFSPVNNKVIIINVKTNTQRIIQLNINNYDGCFRAYKDGDSIWIMPYDGKGIILWTPETNKIKEYTDFPKDFICFNEIHNYECLERPFNSITHKGKYVYFSPFQANMFIRIDTETDKIESWNPPFDMPADYVSDSYFIGCKGIWFNPDFKEPETDLYFSYYNRRLYKINFDNNTYEEISVSMDFNDIKKTESGFGIESQWMGYCCNETYLNSLDRFLDNDIIGNAFDKEAQLRNYSQITNGIDGSCGRKTHEFIKKKVLK